MARILRTFCIGLAIALSACSGASSTGASAFAPAGGEFVGHWMQTRNSFALGKNYMQYLDITQDGATFMLNFHSPAWMGTTGMYPATYQNGMLHPATPDIGDIAYLKSSNAILVSGGQYTRAD